MISSKKRNVGLLVLTLVLAFVFTVHKIEANEAPVNQSLLVTELLNPWDFTLVILNMSTSTGPTQYTLPSTTNHGGDIYVIKTLNDTENGADIYPAGGDTISGYEGDGRFSLSPAGGGGRSVQLAADEDQNVWYVVGGNW